MAYETPSVPDDEKSREQVIRQTVARFGVRLQSTVCMEECAELSLIHI